mgnify:CR=1 FL=1
MTIDGISITVLGHRRAGLLAYYRICYVDNVMRHVLYA